MLGTSARLLRLLSVLQARQLWTGAELTVRLEVTDRTLRRDMERLRSLGYPVSSTSGPAGGYSLGAGASLPPLMLDDDEAVAVAVALETAAGGTVSDIEDAAQRALGKLEKVLPVRLRRRLKSLRGGIVKLRSAGPRVGLETVSLLAAACSDSLEVAFRYADREGAQSQRRVEPHRLVQAGRHWYLVAWDTKRKDFRTFRVDRVEEPHLAGKSFTPRPSPEDDITAYVGRSLGFAPYPVRASVLLLAPIDVIRPRVSQAAGVLRAVGSLACRLETGAPSLEAMAWYLASLDIDFEVESPEDLRDHLRRSSERMARAADPARRG